MRPTLALVLALVPTVARAEEAPHIGIIDVSDAPAPEALLNAVEADVLRLRPGTKPVADPSMRRLLATGEGMVEAATRLYGEARRLREAGECATALSRAEEADALVLESIAIDDERDMLRGLYVVMVACGVEAGRPETVKTGARRLRLLVSTPPEGLSQELWDAHVAPVEIGPPTVELFVDSEPANAQVSVNHHAEGGTPRTLKVPAGEVTIEVQKDGYRKAFRRLTAERAPLRSVFRLVDRARDKQAQATALLRLVRKDAFNAHPSTLGRLAQLARAESLVLVRVEGDRAKLSFFDAEKGAMGSEVIDSTFDAATGRVEALARRPTPRSGAGGGTPGFLAPVSASGVARAPGETEAAKPEDALPEADASVRTTPPSAKRKKAGAPWWSWAIAAAVLGGVAAIVYADQPDRKETLDVRARFVPPQPPP